MSLGELLEKGLIKRAEKDSERAKKILLVAGRDLKFSEQTLGRNLDWAFAIAYNSMLQAGRALMQKEGFIPSGTQPHLAVVKFVQVRCKGKINQGILLVFDKMRQRRHKAVYDETETISFGMANQAISAAKQFIGAIEKELKRN